MSLIKRLLRQTKRSTEQKEPKARKDVGTKSSDEKPAAEEPRKRKRTAEDVDDSKGPRHFIPISRDWH